mmetsp:Transcript_31796/g.90310  ORF Transcript_31796/g.90310 Transcript_31796/m.90310 type:complete len:340 (+) Transcript_31796:2613-3632(+)
MAQLQRQHAFVPRVRLQQLQVQQSRLPLAVRLDGGLVPGDLLLRPGLGVQHSHGLACAASSAAVRPLAVPLQHPKQLQAEVGAKLDVLHKHPQGFLSSGGQRGVCVLRFVPDNRVVAPPGALMARLEEKAAKPEGASEEGTPVHQEAPAVAGVGAVQRWVQQGVMAHLKARLICHKHRPGLGPAHFHWGVLTGRPSRRRWGSTTPRPRARGTLPMPRMTGLARFSLHSRVQHMCIPPRVGHGWWGEVGASPVRAVGGGGGATSAVVVKGRLYRRRGLREVTLGRIMVLVVGHCVGLPDRSRGWDLVGTVVAVRGRRVAGNASVPAPRPPGWRPPAAVLS